MYIPDRWQDDSDGDGADGQFNDPWHDQFIKTSNASVEKDRRDSEYVNQMDDTASDSSDAFEVNRNVESLLLSIKPVSSISQYHASQPQTLYRRPFRVRRKR